MAVVHNQHLNVDLGENLILQQLDLLGFEIFACKKKKKIKERRVSGGGTLMWILTYVAVVALVSAVTRTVAGFEVTISVNTAAFFLTVHPVVCLITSCKNKKICSSFNFTRPQLARRRITLN